MIICLYLNHDSNYFWCGYNFEVYFFHSFEIIWLYNMSYLRSDRLKIRNRQCSLTVELLTELRKQSPSKCSRVTETLVSCNMMHVFDTHRYAAFPSSSSLLFPLEPLFFPHILLVMHINNPHCRMKKQLTSVTTRINRSAATPRPMTAPSPRPLKSVS